MWKVIGKDGENFKVKKMLKQGSQALQAMRTNPGSNPFVWDFDDNLFQDHQV